MQGEILFHIDVMLARRKMTVTQLAEQVGITMANMSILKNGKAKALKMSTLMKLCQALDCQPGDLLEYKETE
ncbi:MAG: helix-turn-helix domain-containing protein [Acutalibacteraceae bacterium]|nr:helix-turn-helix transcriptional regulator [Bacillota bacterium]